MFPVLSPGEAERMQLKSVSYLQYCSHPRPGRVCMFNAATRFALEAVTWYQHSLKMKAVYSLDHFTPPSTVDPINPQMKPGSMNDGIMKMLRNTCTKKMDLELTWGYFFSRICDV